MWQALLPTELFASARFIFETVALYEGQAGFI